METYLFKFSACLAIFWLVYILFLERQTMHRFKRFYLLGAIIAALVIPALTITHYIEPIVTGFEVSPLFIPIETTVSEIIPQVQAPFWDLETVLWTIYGLGVLLFSIRFVINLYNMYRRISENERITKRSFIYILLNECHIPHSFFKYLFFDRSKFENSSIPEEVKLHEETHAKQLHSLDIIVIELLQIVFWFHPLIYILKHHVKLNHEFLADQAVLKQGSDTKTYQNILLQFSSPDSYRDSQEYQLSSAINYSSIKKRFTVMKTQTSKTRIWVSSLLLLPIIAILFYSFAEKEYVEKETIETSATLQIEKVVQIEGATERGIKEFQEKATIKQLEEYNTLAKKYNEQPKAQRVIPANDLRQLESIYRLMSNNQKEESLPFPECNLFSEQEPPIMVILINRKGQLLVDDELGSLESIETKLKTLAKSFDNSKAVFVKYDPSDASEKAFKDVRVLIRKYDFKVIHSDASQDAPPPPPTSKKTKGGPNLEDSKDIYNLSFLEYIIEMEKDSASFYLDGKKIKSSEAKSIAKNNNGKSTEMLTQKDANGKYVVKLSSSVKNYTYARSIELKILNDKSYLIDGLKATKSTLTEVFNQLHQDITPEVRNKIINIHLSSSKEISNKEVWFIYNSLIDYGFYRIVTDSQVINRAKGNKPLAIESRFSTQEKATPEQVAEYNAWAKKLNSQDMGERIIKKRDHDKFKSVYKIMSSEQKKNAEPFPQLPPPPPPPPAPKVNNGEVSDIPPPPPPAVPKNSSNKKTLNEIIEETPKSVESGYEILENGESHYFTVYKNTKTYYNKDGYITNDKGEILPPPPPSPESTLDFIIRMAKANAKFFNEGKSISSDEAIDLLKKNPKLNINAQKTETEQPLVYITKKPVVINDKVKSKN